MKKSPLLILNIGLFLSLFAPAAWPASWRSIGPDGGAVNALAFAPSDARVVYAGTSGGVFRSSDGGSSWAAVSNGLGSLTVVSVAVDPKWRRPRTSDVAGPPSLDAGATWSPLGDGFPFTIPTAIALDSGRHVLYVGTQSAGTWALNLP